MATTNTELEKKYQELREYAKGKVAMIVLCRSEEFVGRKICQITKSYYSHSLILYWCEIAGEKRLCVFESQPDGAKPKFASDRLLKLYTDFCSVELLVAENTLKEAFNKLLNKSELGIKYDFKQIAKIATYELSNGKINPFKRKPLDIEDDKAICSETSWFLTHYANINCYSKKFWVRPYFLPQHFDLLADDKEILIKHDNRLR